jgi:A/G-specific adenine glycosylase
MQENIGLLQKTVWNFYGQHKRDFPWRDTNDPYFILASEIMLQQTQTSRVLSYYEKFVREFPTVAVLAQASLVDVLLFWQGLGYNRRGKYLHQIAKILLADYKSLIPQKPEILETLPGIGHATARSICAFAFNMPTIFIETNIRTVFIHTFFKDSSQVDDKQLMPLIAQAVDHENARHWYYALMDYGVYLKSLCKNENKQSKHYTVQSKFEGSDRQIRGLILAYLIKNGSTAAAVLFQEIVDRRNMRDQERFNRILSGMAAEDLVCCGGGQVVIR